MPTPRRKPAATGKAAKLRSWTVSIMRSRAHVLGVRLRPGREGGGSRAIAEFNIDDERRRRLIVREQE
jgi:hypothetical protein